MPWVKRYENNGTYTIETLQERYERVVDILWGEDADSELKKNYRERLLGPDLIALVPERYSIIDHKKKYLGEWANMTLEEKGELIAHSILENQVELIKEHLREQKRIAEEQKAKVERERKGQKG